MEEKYNQILTLVLTAKNKMSPNFDENIPGSYYNVS